MKDRSLLLSLLITVAFIFYVKPERENIALMRTRLVVLDAQIAAQKALKAERTRLGGRVKATHSAATANEEYLFPPSRNASLALADLQETVKTLAAAHRIEILNSTWGEPVSDQKTGRTTIPMSFTMKGGPADLDRFLQKLLHGRRFIRVERAGITKAPDQLQLSLSLVAFKRDGSHD